MLFNTTQQKDQTQRLTFMNKTIRTILAGAIAATTITLAACTDETHNTFDRMLVSWRQKTQPSTMPTGHA